MVRVALDRVLRPSDSSKHDRRGYLVHASHGRNDGIERGIRDHPLHRHLNGVDVVNGDDAPTLDHGNTIGGYGGFASLCSGLDPCDQAVRYGLDHGTRDSVDDRALV